MVRVYSTENTKNFRARSSQSEESVRGSARNRNDEEIVYLKRQTKGRRGKAVIIISGLPNNKLGLGEISKKLKTKCGVGGAVIKDTILIQGDKRDILRQELESMGYKVKLSGG